MVLGVMLVLPAVAQGPVLPEKVNPRVVAELDGYSEGVVSADEGACGVAACALAADL